MIGQLNHVAIATKNIAAAAKVYRDTLGAKVSDAVPQPDHGVTTVFVELPNTKIELLEPLGENSPIAKFLEKIRAAGCTMSVTKWTTFTLPATACGRRGRRSRAPANRASAPTANR